MGKEQKGILTSAGNLGIESRTYDRLYWNWEGDPVVNIQTLIDSFRQLSMRGEMEGKTRVVFRGLVDEQTARSLFEERNPLTKYIEVAMPVIDNAGLWLLMLARNSPKRRSIVPVETMVKSTLLYNKDQQSISGRMQGILEKGYSLKDAFDEQLMSQVYELWGETFGWTFDQVTNLSTMLAQQQELAPSERWVWFSGVDHNSLLVSIATAERLRLKTQNGYLDVVESTEWRTREGFENRGLLTSAIAYLNAQIFYVLPNPLVVAECNFQSRSDRPAHGAGFVIPRREVGEITVPQILVQNVSVKDGYEPTGLRDFTFMYVSQNVRERLYAKDEIFRIMDLAKKSV